MPVRRASGAVLAACMLMACAAAPPGAGKPGRLDSRGYYIVKSGDTLSGIATRYGVNYKTLARINGLRSVHLIHPGQKLAIKGPAVQAQAQRGTATRPRRAAAASPPSGYVNREGWRWPTGGRVVRGYTQSGKVHKGIDIGGKLSQPVVASKSGKVVYAGTGLKAYGLLVIIRHDDHYLSAYAYNRKAFVREGDTVKRGQQIALMGAKGDGQAKLHFEIRKDGKPLNPITLLPRR